MAQQRWTEAMDELLEILMRDKAWNEDLARKTYIADPRHHRAAQAQSGRRPDPAGRPDGGDLPAPPVERCAELKHAGSRGLQAVRRCSASRYLAAVFSITSCGKRGAGGVLSQGLPLMRTASSQSRTNCLS